MGAHQMRDGVTLSHQRRQEFVVLDSEIRHLKKREAFLVTSGGWPVTKLLFDIKNRSGKHPAIIERDLSIVSHQIESIEQTIENLKLDLNSKSEKSFEGYSKSNTLPLLDDEMELF